MNVGNQLGSRPSIRLYPGVSSGGSFASFCGGTDQKAVPASRGQAASQILKQVQQQKSSSTNLAAGRSAQAAPACAPLARESADNSIRRRTVIDTAQSQHEVENSYQPAYGQGHRILPDRHAPKPVGGEIEAGYGIGNRTVEQPTHRGRKAAPAPAEGTSLSFGSEKQQPVRSSRRRGPAQQVDRPDWMGGSTATATKDQRRTIDCSPPTSDTETNFPPQQAAVQQAVQQAVPQAVPQQVNPMPALSREEFDRLMEREMEARQQEARNYQSSNSEYNQSAIEPQMNVPGLQQTAAPPRTDRRYTEQDVPGLGRQPAMNAPQQQSSNHVPAGRRRKGNGDRFVLEDGTQRTNERSNEDVAAMRMAASKRMNARPF